MAEYPFKLSVRKIYELNVINTKNFHVIVKNLSSKMFVIIKCMLSPKTYGKKRIFNIARHVLLKKINVSCKMLSIVKILWQKKRIVDKAKNVSCCNKNASQKKTAKSDKDYSKSCDLELWV